MTTRKKKDTEIKVDEIEEVVPVVEPEPGPELVKMKHAFSDRTADVHPDEVKNYIKGDYVEVK